MDTEKIFDEPGFVLNNYITTKFGKKKNSQLKYV